MGRDPAAPHRHRRRLGRQLPPRSHRRDLDLTAFYDLVCRHAHHLAVLGDTDPLGARKAKALALIADTQTHLDLTSRPGHGQARTR